MSARIWLTAMVCGALAQPAAQSPLRAQRHGRARLQPGLVKGRSNHYRGGINGAATIWDADTGTMAAKIFVSWPARNDVNGVTWSPHGGLVAVAHGAGGIGGVTLWSPVAGTVGPLLSNGGWQRGIAWSPDGHWLAAGGGEGSVRILNVETSAVAAMLPTNSKPVWCVAWSPDGQRLAAGNTGRAGCAPADRAILSRRP